MPSGDIKSVAKPKFPNKPYALFPKQKPTPLPVRTLDEIKVDIAGRILQVVSDLKTAGCKSDPKYQGLNDFVLTPAVGTTIAAFDVDGNVLLQMKVDVDINIPENLKDLKDRFLAVIRHSKLAPEDNCFIRFLHPSIQQRPMVFAHVLRHKYLIPAGFVPVKFGNGQIAFF